VLADSSRTLANTKLTDRKCPFDSRHMTGTVAV